MDLMASGSESKALASLFENCSSALASSSIISWKRVERCCA